MFLIDFIIIQKISNVVFFYPIFIQGSRVLQSIQVENQSPWIKKLREGTKDASTSSSLIVTLRTFHLRIPWISSSGNNLRQTIMKVVIIVKSSSTLPSWLLLCLCCCSCRRLVFVWGCFATIKRLSFCPHGMTFTNGYFSSHFDHSMQLHRRSKQQKLIVNGLDKRG